MLKVKGLDKARKKKKKKKMYLCKPLKKKSQSPCVYFESNIDGVFKVLFRCDMDCYY